MFKKVKQVYTLGSTSLAMAMLSVLVPATASAKLEKKVLSENFVSTTEEVQKGGFLAIFKNLAVQFSSLWGFVFTMTAILGLLSCVYGALKFKEAGRQDSDTQKDPLNKKGMWAMVIGVVLLSFSAFIAIFADTAGVGGVVATGAADGQRIGVDALDGQGIGSY